MALSEDTNGKEAKPQPNPGEDNPVPDSNKDQPERPVLQGNSFVKTLKSIGSAIWGFIKDHKKFEIYVLSVLGLVFVILNYSSTVDTNRSTREVNESNIQKNNVELTSIAASATADISHQTAEARETAAAKADANVQGTQTQNAIDTASAEAAYQAEQQIEFKGYYLCSRALDLEQPDVRNILNDILSSRGVQLGKLMITSYWNNMYGSTDREYLFVILANTGEVKVGPA